MATKIYLRNTAETVPISPSASTDWETTSLLARALARTTKTSDTLTTVAFTDATSTDKDVLFRQYIAPLAAGQTITGAQALKFQVRATETGTGNNMFTALGIRVIASDGTTVQKTVLAVTRDNTETTTSLVNRQFTATSAATNYTTVDGDYLVIEIGMAGDPTGSNPHDSSMRLGDSAASDLAEDDSTTTDNNPWVQLTDTLTLGVSSAAGTAGGTSTSTATGISTFAANASAAAGVGAATAVGLQINGGAGASAGTAAASAVGSFIASDSRTVRFAFELFDDEQLKVFELAHPAVGGAGEASGSGSASGIGAAIDAAIGAIAGVAACLAIGALLMAGAGSAAGVGSASGVGSSDGESSGSVACVATASGVGISTVAASGSAGGVSTTPSGIGASTFAAVGATAGTSTALAEGDSTSIGDTGPSARAMRFAFDPFDDEQLRLFELTGSEWAGSSSGVGTASAVGISTAAAAGSSAGTGSATALSVGGISQGTAAGTGSAAAVGDWLFSKRINRFAFDLFDDEQPRIFEKGATAVLAIGTGQGNCVVSGVGAPRAAATAATSGTGAATAVGRSTAAGVGTSPGTSTVSAVAQGAAAGAGSAAGVGAATAVYATTFSGAGSASGQSTVSGIGSSRAAAMAESLGAGSASGISGASPTAFSTFRSTLSLMGTPTETIAGALGPIVVNGVGVAAGVATAAATPPISVSGAGSSAGHGAATALSIPPSTQSGVGLSHGTGAAIGRSGSTINSGVTYRVKATSRTYRVDRERRVVSIPVDEREVLLS